MLRLALRLTLLLLCALLPVRAWAAVGAPSEIRVTGEAAENRVKGLEAPLVYCTYRATLATPRLHLGNEPALRGKASAPLFRWKGRWWSDFGGPDGTYDMRARVWSPELGIFLSADAFAYHDARGTLWSWPNQNPVNLSDPSGNRGDSNAVRDSVMGGGLLSFVPSFKLFAVGTQMRADGISMMANEATFEEGDAKRRCGSNIIGLSMGIAGNDAAVLAGIAGMIPGLVRSAEVVAEAAAEAGERAAITTRSLDPLEVRLSQSSVNGVPEIEASMKASGWNGAPIDVVQMADGQLTTFDNTRVVAANRAGINVRANIHNAAEPFPDGRWFKRDGTQPQTWGDAIRARIQQQNAGYRTRYPNGSSVTGASE